MKNEAVLKINNLTKRFGTVIANDHIDLTLNKGEILAILGENGSGKTTLINMISGIYFPDEGSIEVGGREVVIRSPKDAYELGIGVVHQHFKLVERMNALENIRMGMNAYKKISSKELKEKVQAIAEKYHFNINLQKQIRDMSVSEKQTVEIIKMLVRGAEILILDEPTAVLAQQEAKNLFDILRTMQADGKAIIIITHKLQEVLDISDNVYIMRKGRYIDSIKTSEADEKLLTELMVGHTMELSLERPIVEEGQEIIRVGNMSCKDLEGNQALNDITFSLKRGEILGIAGIAGSGQKELCEALAGVWKVDEGSIAYCKEGEELEIGNMGPLQREKKDIRIGFVPEDRLGMGLISDGDLVENVMLRNYRKPKGPFINKKEATEIAQGLVEQLEIATPDLNTPIRLLSGGNVQKVLLGREIKQRPDVLIVAYPVRGLDINSSYTVYRLLNEEKKKGVAIIFVGEDLDVLMGISDRIMVLSQHRITGIVDGPTATKEDIGRLMIL